MKYNLREKQKKETFKNMYSTSWTYGWGNYTFQKVLP